MAHLPRRQGDAIERLVGRDTSPSRRSLPPRIQRATETGVAVEHGRALVQAARIRGLERVAHEAMQAVGGLSRDEAFWMQHMPAHAAGRFALIADNAAINMANIVDETGRD